MSDEIFFDTNVLIYAALQTDPRSTVARAALARGGMISIQVINEFVHVARRKLKQPWPAVLGTLADLRRLCSGPVPLTVAIHDSALRLAQATQYGIYDSLILAAALQAGCTTLLSEDMQDGQVIAGRLTICNPFAACLEAS